ncbi:MAG: hypothetical protein R6U95_06395 [Bacteroidales bacterium]
MANLRQFKKELRVGLEIVFEECFILQNLFPDKKEETMALMQETIDLYQHARIQQTDMYTHDKKPKTVFKDIRAEYLNGILAVLNKIEQIHQDNEK